MPQFPKALELYNTHAFLNAIPGFLAIKEVHDSISYFIWCNSTAMDVFGLNQHEFSKVSDADLRCQASQNSELFNQHDQLTLKNHTIQTLDLYQYATNNVIGLLGEKKVMQVDPSATSNKFVMMSAQLLTHSMLNQLMTIINKQADYPVSSKKNHTLVFIEKYSQLQLSPRESECFYYILRGKTAKEISGRMKISLKTVQTYIESIKIKTNLRTKSQLFDLAYELKILNVIPRSIIYKGETILV